MIELRTSEDILLARVAARNLARQAGLSVMDQTRFATAVSELGRNAVCYGLDGHCELSDESDSRHLRLQARVTDRGPGIADIAKAMQDGYSTGGSLGVGLPGTRRLVDLFDLLSSPEGTCVTIQIIRRRG